VKELWLPIPIDPSYEASTLGRIRSKDRWCTYSDGRRSYFRKGQVRKPTARNKDRKPYLSLALGNNKKKHLVHQLVAITFLGDFSATMEVNHKDGNPANNQVDNLEWVTRSQNQEHSYRVLSRVPAMKGMTGELHHLSKPVVATNLESKEETRYTSISEAHKAGYRGETVINCCKGNRTSYKGFYWRYAE